MEFSCYYNEDLEKMTTFAFAFAKKDDIIFVEFFKFSSIDGNLDEDICSFFINKSNLQNNTNLNDFYKLSLILTENPSKLFYQGKCLFVSCSHHSWGICCKKHCMEKGFTDEYDYNFGFTEHPSDKFDRFQKGKGMTYNKHSISYYKTVYEGTFDSENYIDMYIVQEIDKIEKELFNIDVCVQIDIMRCNANILKEVLPQDLVDNIKSMIFA
jgi:hypothetical protein